MRHVPLSWGVYSRRRMVKLRTSRFRLRIFAGKHSGTRLEELLKTA